jgi:hypothetical protein
MLHVQLEGGIDALSDNERPLSVPAYLDRSSNLRLPTCVRFIGKCGEEGPGGR